MVTHAEVGCVQFRFIIAWKDNIYIDSLLCNMCELSSAVIKPSQTCIITGLFVMCLILKLLPSLF